MKLSTLFNIVGLCFYMSCTQPYNAYAQNKSASTASYTVKAGDTATAIARLYNISLARLLELNPGLQAEQLRPNQLINVPAAQQNIRQKAYIEYVVKRKDTPYSLAKAHHITVEELMAANPQLNNEGSKLKKGAVIRIPVKNNTAKSHPNGLRTIRVAVVLPLIGNGVENERSTEFYRGMLLGIDALKQTGINVHISAYNEPEPEMGIATLIQQVRTDEPDVIVGPLYPSHFGDVAAEASQRTKVVIPFSSKVPQLDTNPNLFLLNTPTKYELSLATDLFVSTFKKPTTIVLLHSIDGNRKAFHTELQRRLMDSGYKIVTLSASETAEQIKKALGNKNKGEYVIIPDDARQESLNALLPKVSSLKDLLPNAKIALLGYDSWLPLSEGNTRAALHRADTYILAANYYYPHTQAAIDFNKAYEQWFKTQMLDSRPRMAPLGYDFSHAFLGGMVTYGYNFSTQSPMENSIAALPKLQTDLRFAAVGNGGGYLNRSMWLVHFKSDMTIVKHAAR